MFDADAAGQNAIVRSAEPLWDAGVVIRVAVLPPGHDPDSFVKAFGAEKLKELVTKAPSFFLYLLDRLSQQHDPRSERGKLQIARQMAEWLARIPTPILLATYAQQTAKRLDIGEDVLRKEVTKLAGSRRDRSHMAGGDDEADDTANFDEERPRGLPAEEMLLRTMLADERVVEMTAERLDLVWVSNSLAGQTIQEVLRLYNGRNWTGPNALLNQPQSDPASRLISELLLNQQTVKQPEAAAADCLATLEQRWVKQRLSEVRRKLEQPGLSAADSAPLHQQLLDLDSKLRHIATFLKGKP